MRGWLADRVTVGGTKVKIIINVIGAEFKRHKIDGGAARKSMETQVLERAQLRCLKEGLKDLKEALYRCELMMDRDL